MTRALLVLAAGLLAACTLNNPDPMRAQHKEKAYGYEPFFSDDRAMRPLVEDTVPRERGLVRDRPPAGGSADAGYVDRYPSALTPELFAEGEQGFTIYCATCHGLLGNGDSEMAHKVGLRAPPALYGPLHPPHGVAPAPPGSALPHPRGYFVQVMTDGYGLMPSYASALTLEQRWAVAAYIEALALSQAVPVAQLPAPVRARLEGEVP